MTSAMGATVDTMRSSGPSGASVASVSAPSSLASSAVGWAGVAPSSVWRGTQEIARAATAAVAMTGRNLTALLRTVRKRLGAQPLRRQ